MAIRELQQMCLRLTPTNEATTLARGLVDEACLQWRLQHLQDNAELIITELVTNVIRHANTDMEVRIRTYDGVFELSVRDGSPNRPELGSRDDWVSEAGRGLLVIDALSAAWGSTPTADGKIVWAKLPTGHN
jgi:anti-sigma regulatory factor (Ser/Thr protein kinase)